MYFGDFNGDGKSDVLLMGNAMGQSAVLMISTGTGWQQRALTGFGGAVGGEWNWAGDWVASPVRTTHADDLNGDGKTEILLQGNGTSQATILVQRTNIPDLMTSVSNGLGAITNI